MQKEEAHAGSVERHYKNGATVRFLKGEPPGRKPDPVQETLTEADAGDFGDGNQCETICLHEGIGDLERRDCL